MTNAVHQYGQSVNGARACSIRPNDRIEIQVRPGGEESNTEALSVATDLANAGDTIAALRAEVRSLRSLADRHRAACDVARSERDAALDGRRRFFSAVVVAPAAGQTWAGRVWLMDPEKRERGRTLEFASLRDLREAHPELWIVGSNADGSITLDAWGS